MRPLGILIGAGLLAAPASAGDSKLTLFRDRNFNGPAVTLTEANSNFTFSPRSVKLSGTPWLLCERPFFGGRCQEERGDEARLNLHRSFSGMVRSARPVALPAPPPPVRPTPPERPARPPTPVEPQSTPEPPKPPEPGKPDPKP